jgi:hypothetical protein
MHLSPPLIAFLYQFPQFTHLFLQLIGFDYPVYVLVRHTHFSGDLRFGFPLLKELNYSVFLIH